MSYQSRLNLILSLPPILKNIVPGFLKNFLTYRFLREKNLRKIDNNIPIGDIYYGNIASDYDFSRSKSDFWSKEQDIVFNYLKFLLSKYYITSLLSTSRYRKILVYVRDLGLKFIGVDLSSDMLKCAKSKDFDHSLDNKFLCGNLESVKSITTDLFVSIRFLQGIIPESAAIDHLKYFSKNAPFSIIELNVGYVSTKTDDLSVPMLYKYSYMIY